MNPPTTVDELIVYLHARAEQVRDLQTLQSGCESWALPSPTIDMLVRNTLADTERDAAACLAGLQS
jgi:hypothetical protein